MTGLPIGWHGSECWPITRPSCRSTRATVSQPLTRRDDYIHIYTYIHICQQTHNITTTTTSQLFIFNRSIIPELFQTVMLQKNEFLGTAWADFCRPYAIAVAQPTAAKHVTVTNRHGSITVTVTKWNIFNSSVTATNDSKVISRKRKSFLTSINVLQTRKGCVQQL